MIIDIKKISKVNDFFTQLKDKDETNLTELYTGLIIDCTDWEDKSGELLNPVLAPVIKNTDGLHVYSYSNLDYSKAIEKGVAGYFADKDDAMTSGKVGNNPLVVKIIDIQDSYSNPIISAADTENILRANYVSNFLDNGNVVFISHCTKPKMDNNRGYAGTGIRTRGSRGDGVHNPPPPHAHSSSGSIRGIRDNKSQGVRSVKG